MKQREREREREREGRLGQINSLPYECVCENSCEERKRVPRVFDFFIYYYFEPAPWQYDFLSYVLAMLSFLGPTQTLPNHFMLFILWLHNTLLSSAWACSIYGCYWVNSADLVSFVWIFFFTLSFFCYYYYYYYYFI